MFDKVIESIFAVLPIFIIPILYIFIGITKVKLNKVEQILNKTEQMYSYHNTIKSRIKKGELIGCEYVNDYKNIGECLLLYFNTQPFIRPIRPHMYTEYEKILGRLLMENKIWMKVCGENSDDF